MRSIKVVVDAVNVVLRNLGQVPIGPEAEGLRAKAAACIREAEAWRADPPSVEQREALMKRVLGLHTAMSRLGRASSP